MLVSRIMKILLSVFCYKVVYHSVGLFLGTGLFMLLVSAPGGMMLKSMLV